MHYHLCRLVDRSAVDADPPHWRVPTWQSCTVLDFSPPVAGPRGDRVGQGLALMAVAQRDGDVERAAGGIYLGDDLDDESAGRLLMARMGLTFKGARPTLREAIVDLFVEHSTQPNDKSRWNPLAVVPRTSRYVGDCWEVWLGNEVIWRLPVVQGGATYTESFDKANSTTLGPDLTWQEVTGNSGVTNNQAENYSTALGRMKALSDCATNNNYAKFTSKTPSGGSYYDVEMGAICRYHATASTDTGYLSWVDYNIGVQNHIDKVVQGTRTTLADLLAFSGAGGATGTVYEMRAIGSSISHWVNGVSVLSVTDTAITTGTKGGFQLRHTSAANRAALDDFAMGDAATPSVSARPRHRMSVPTL